MSAPSRKRRVTAQGTAPTRQAGRLSSEHEAMLYATVEAERACQTSRTTLTDQLTMLAAQIDAAPASMNVHLGDPYPETPAEAEKDDWKEDSLVTSLSNFRPPVT